MFELVQNENNIAFQWRNKDFLTQGWHNVDMQTCNNNFYITCTLNDMSSTYFPLYSDISHWQAPYAPIDPATKHCFQFLRWQNLTVESLYSNLDNYSREIEILKNVYARYRVNILKEKSNYTVGDCMASCCGHIKATSMIPQHLLLTKVHSLTFTCQFRCRLHVLSLLLFELHQEPCFHQVYSAAQGALYWPTNKT